VDFLSGGGDDLDWEEWDDVVILVSGRIWFWVGVDELWGGVVKLVVGKLVEMDGLLWESVGVLIIESEMGAGEEGIVTCWSRKLSS
jgi:hypothetical protein